MLSDGSNPFAPKHQNARRTVRNRAPPQHEAVACVRAARDKVRDHEHPTTCVSDAGVRRRGGFNTRPHTTMRDANDKGAPTPAMRSNPTASWRSARIGGESPLLPRALHGGPRALTQGVDRDRSDALDAKRAGAPPRQVDHVMLSGLGPLVHPIIDAHHH